MAFQIARLFIVSCLLAFLIGSVWCVAQQQENLPRIPAPLKASSARPEPVLAAERGWALPGIYDVNAADELGGLVACTGNGILLLYGADRQTRRLAVSHLGQRATLTNRGKEVVVCVDSTLQIRDIETDKVVATLKPQGGPNRVVDIVTPATQARVVVVGMSDGSVIHWAPDSDCPERIVKHEGRELASLSCSADGKTVAIRQISSDDRTGEPLQEILIWQPLRQQAIRQVRSPQGKGKPIVSPSGSRIAIVDSGLMILNAADHKVVAQFRDPITLGPIAWVDEDRLVFLTRKDESKAESRPGRSVESVACWSVTKNGWVWQTPIRYSKLSFSDGNIQQIAASQKLGKVIWLEGNQLINVCDLKTGQLEPGWAGSEHPRLPLVFSHHRPIVYGWQANNETLMGWDLAGKHREPRQLAHLDRPDWQKGMLLSECGDWAAVWRTDLSQPDEARIRVVPLRPELGETWEPKPNLSAVQLLHLGSGGKDLLVLGRTNIKNTPPTAKLVRLTRGNVEPISALPSDPGSQQASVSLNAFCSRTGRYVCLAYQLPKLGDKPSCYSVHVWDLLEKVKIHTIEYLPDFQRAVIGASGEWMICYQGGGINQLACYDLKQSAIRWKLPHRYLPNEWPLSRDDYLVICVNDDRSARKHSVEVRERTSGTLLCECNLPAWTATFSQDDLQLYAVGLNRVVWQFNWREQLANDHPGQQPLSNAIELLKNPTREGYAALEYLARQPQESVRTLTKSDLELPVTQHQLSELLRNLRDDDFDKRSTARNRLQAIGPIVNTTLQIELRKTTDLDYGKSLREVLENMPALDCHPAGIRDRRIVHLLERMNTAESRRLLQSYADGDSLTYRFHYAKAALQRLRQP